jgi:hypothetical protein
MRGLGICLFMMGVFGGHVARADSPAVYIPVDETASQPAVDLMSASGQPQDPARLIDSIRNGLDTSTLEPRRSNLYVANRLPLVRTEENAYPAEGTTLQYQGPLPYTRGLVRARVASAQNPDLSFQLAFSLDTHAALARNALLRALGYNIPSPRYFARLPVQFGTLADRDKLLDLIADKTLTARGRWVVGGLEEINKNKTTIVFQDIVLEPALIEVPQMHWGILTSATIQGRRPIRALIAPLSILDITESVNMLSYEAAKISNANLVFTRPYADAFTNETSIGDVRWIARRIAGLSRPDWTYILQAGHYPPDIQALLVEKVIGRALQLLDLLQIPARKDLQPDPYVTSGQVINGKAMQENYDGYALRFTYGDPESPLRASELARFFGIESVSNGIGFLLNQIGSSLQLVTPDHYIQQHNNKVLADISEHLQNRPNEPYVLPLQVWGGPVAGGRLSASRNIVTGTYYGSKSEVQLVDSVSAGVSVGAFLGVSGISRISIGLSPQIQYNRSYLHVRPIADIKTAFKDNWKNLYVPHFMNSLANILNGEVDQAGADAIKQFLDSMKTGEMFMVTDGFSAGNGTTVGIPIGALLGLLPPFSQLSESVSLGNQYGILARTTIYKAKDGLHVYLSRIHSKTFELTLDTSFFVKLISIASSKSNGDAHTQAFVFPEKFENSGQEKAFQRAITSLLRRNSPHLLEEEFYPYTLDHEVEGGRFRFQFGPWSWTNRVNFHRLDIVPPYDPQGRYKQEDQKRTVIQGERTRVQGTDLYGFFGRLVNRVIPFINIGKGGAGDDPSTNFLGRSKTFAVSTEVELTPGRPNQLFTKLQQSFNGWSMRRNRLLRLVDEMVHEVEEFNPQGQIVSREQFSQTKKIQAYTLNWTLLVYERGIERLMRVLDPERTPTRDAQAHLVKVMGADKYQEWCERQGYEPGVNEGPYDFEPGDGSYTENNHGRTIRIGCVTPWMATVYDLRNRLRKHPGAFAQEVRDEDSAVEKIEWVNRALAELERDMDLGQLIRWLGTDASHFQVRISGFRTNDEAADSERYSTYFSNTVGTIDPNVLAGPLSEISDTSQILEHEISARYLSNGY